MSCLYEVKFDDLELLERCGRGSYGNVYKAVWLSRKRQQVAVKKLLSLDTEVFFYVIPVFLLFLYLILLHFFIVF